MPVKQIDVIRDKFLVLVIPVIDVKDTAELWKVFQIHIFYVLIMSTIFLFANHEFKLEWINQISNLLNLCTYT